MRADCKLYWPGLVPADEWPQWLKVECLDEPNVGMMGRMSVCPFGGADEQPLLFGPVFCEGGDGKAAVVIDPDPVLELRPFDDRGSLKPTSGQLWNVRWETFAALETPQRVPVRSVYGDEGYMEVHPFRHADGGFWPKGCSAGFYIHDGPTSYRVLDVHPVVRCSPPGKTERLVRAPAPHPVSG